MAVLKQLSGNTNMMRTGIGQKPQNTMSYQEIYKSNKNLKQ